jgi:Tfp pilus assembly protein PilF
LFREAINRSKDHLPASHNNLGVTLALLGRFPEAEREFEIALEQTSSKYDDALYNLALCRSRLNSARAKRLALTSTDVGGQIVRPFALATSR